jgi:Na+/phosphate symporter
MSKSCPISPIGLTIISIAISLILIATLESEELNVLGNVLSGIGGIIVIAATQGEFLNGLKEKEEQKDFMEKLALVLREKK